MTADECEFEHEGHCAPPECYKDFVCPDAIFVEGFWMCNGNNNQLMTEEEYEERFVNVERTVRDDWEMKGFQRK